MISSTRKHLKTRAGHLQSQSLRIVTLMLVDLNIWSPHRAEEPADHDMISLFTLFTDLESTSVVGDKEVFKAQEGMSPCPKRTSRTVRTTLWPEDQAFFLLRSLGRALFPGSY